MYHGWSPVQLLATRYHSYLLWSAEAEASPFPYALSLPFPLSSSRTPSVFLLTRPQLRFSLRVSTPPLLDAQKTFIHCPSRETPFRESRRIPNRGFIPAVFTRRRRQIHYSSAHAIATVRGSFRSLLSRRGKRFYRFSPSAVRASINIAFLTKKEKKVPVSYTDSTRSFSKSR